MLVSYEETRGLIPLRFFSMMNMNSPKDRLVGLLDIERREVALSWAVFIEKKNIFMQAREVHVYNIIDGLREYDKVPPPYAYQECSPI